VKLGNIWIDCIINTGVGLLFARAALLANSNGVGTGILSACVISAYPVFITFNKSMHLSFVQYWDISFPRIFAGLIGLMVGLSL
jgi:hypothetical protein